MMKNFLTVLILIFAVLASTTLADPFRGNMLNKDITIQSGKSITGLGGASNIDMRLTTGSIFAHNLVVAGTATYGGLIINGIIYNATYIANTLGVRDTTSLNATTVTSLRNTGTTINTGATYLNATTLGGAMAYSVNASTTISTVRTAAGTKTVFGIDAHLANVTITLPDAALVPGRVYQIGTNVDPGTYYVKVTATGGDKLGGSGGFTIAQTTDAKAGMAVVSDGTLYLIYGAYGSWAEGTA